MSRPTARLVTLRKAFMLRGAVALLAAAALVAATPAAAAPFAPTLTRPQLESWFRDLRTTRGLNPTAPLDWRYDFSDAETRRLEALSVRLVADGFRIIALAPAGSGAVLRVAKQELLTPALLARRCAELTKLARDFGVRSFDGFDAAPPG